MATLKEFVIRDGQTDPRTWRERLGEAWRSLWLGPYNTKDATLARLFGGAPASSGEAVNDRRALTVSAFWSAATMIAGDAASLPLHLYRTTTDGGRRRYVEHPLYRLMHDTPNSMMSSMQFRETILLSTLITGNGYAEVERDVSNRPVALWPLAPHTVTPFFDDARQLRYRVPAAGGGEVILTPRDMLHLRGPSADGILGYDVVELARETLGLALASEKYAGRYFANFAQIGGVVTTSGSLTPQARENLRLALEARHQGADRAHRLLLLENNLQYTPTSTTPRDSQFAELREHEVRAIARYFRLPVALLSELSRATWSNFEQSQAQYFMQTIRGWVVRFEQELDRTRLRHQSAASSTSSTPRKAFSGRTHPNVRRFMGRCSTEGCSPSTRYAAWRT